MSPDEFRTYLRDLQNGDGYTWPNDYFAWEKPDGNKFMVGIESGQQFHILLNNYGDSFSSVYSIWPPRFCSYSENGIPYDPVDKLVDQIKDYKFLGTWHDPDLLMESPRSFGRVLAHGRWDLAMQHIEANTRSVPLSEQIKQAESKRQSIHSQTPGRVGEGQER